MLSIWLRQRICLLVKSLKDPEEEILEEKKRKCQLVVPFSPFPTMVSTLSKTEIAISATLFSFSLKFLICLRVE